MYNNTSLNMYSVTCVSSFFVVSNKYSVEKYFEWFKNTLSINCPYVFFTTKDNIEVIKSFRKDLPTYFIETKIEDFYTYKYRDRMASHASHCPSVELNLIWNEKIFMVQKASKINPFNSEWFHWVDAGICSYRSTPPPTTQFPNNEKLKTLPKNKFIYSSSQNYNKELITPTNYYHHIAGTSWIMNKEIIDTVCEIYANYMEKLIDKHNIWMDQVILTHICNDYPDLFFKYCDGYGTLTVMLA